MELDDVVVTSSVPSSPRGSNNNNNNSTGANPIKDLLTAASRRQAQHMAKEVPAAQFFFRWQCLLDDFTLTTVFVAVFGVFCWFLAMNK